MLSGHNPISFRKAVLATESAYLDGAINIARFDSTILDLVTQCTHVRLSNPLIYDRKDKETVSKWASIFKVMTDTTARPLGNVYIVYPPFKYDFEDFYGERDWTKMFVSKLLESGSGNCHSLPYLYKILAEEMGTNANLALAPNHLYIKHKSLKDGWYNTELTSAAFPIDAWIMASGYIHLSAVQNAIYMKALNEKESIALCVVDLAEGYKRRTNNGDPNFVIKCCDLALKHFPNYINALLLKAETLKSVHYSYLKNHPNPTPEIKTKADALFKEMQTLYVHIHQLGYRQMPKEMYLKWLVELKTEKEKYHNKSISGFK